MFLGGSEVGKTTLLKQIRQEGHFSKKMLQSEVFIFIRIIEINF